MKEWGKEIQYYCRLIVFQAIVIIEPDRKDKDPIIIIIIILNNNNHYSVITTDIHFH